MTSKK